MTGDNFESDWNQLSLGCLFIIIIFFFFGWGGGLTELRIPGRSHCLKLFSQLVGWMYHSALCSSVVGNVHLWHCKKWRMFHILETRNTRLSTTVFINVQFTFISIFAPISFQNTLSEWKMFQNSTPNRGCCSQIFSFMFAFSVSFKREVWKFISK